MKIIYWYYLCVEKGTRKGKTDQGPLKSPWNLGLGSFINTEVIILRKVCWFSLSTWEKPKLEGYGNLAKATQLLRDDIALGYCDNPNIKMSQHTKILFLVHTTILVCAQPQPSTIVWGPKHHLSCSSVSLRFWELSLFGGGWGSDENYKWKMFF